MRLNGREGMKRMKGMQEVKVNEERGWQWTEPREEKKEKEIEANKVKERDD